MSEERKVWGDVSSSLFTDLEKEDPIKELIKEADSVKADLSINGTIEDIRKDKQARFAAKEKEVWDAIMLQNMKAMSR